MFLTHPLSSQNGKTAQLFPLSVQTTEGAPLTQPGDWQLRGVS